MHKLIKLLGVLLVISFLTSSLVACKPWESAITLMMTVDSPQDGATITASPVTVSGNVNKTATVKINDVVVPVNGGKFSSDVTLTGGSNTISVVAMSGEEKVSRTLTVKYTPAK